MAKQHFENLEKTLTLSKNQIHSISTTHSYESLIIVLSSSSCPSHKNNQHKIQQ